MSGETPPGSFSLAQRDVKAKSFLPTITTSTSLIKKAKRSLDRTDYSDFSSISFTDEYTQDDRQTTSCDEPSMQLEMTPLVRKSRIVNGVYGLPPIPEPVTERRLASCWTKECYKPRIAHCTRMQVYKMANREIAGYPLDKEPKTMHVCKMYSSWIQRKKHLQEALLAVVKLDDLLYIEKTAAMERVDISMEWNKLAARGLEKSDDGRRQLEPSKPDLSDLPKSSSLAEPTKKYSKGINRHKVMLTENEPLVSKRRIPEFSKRPKRKETSKPKLVETSVTTIVEKPMSSLVMSQWRRQTRWPALMSRKRTGLFSGDKILKQQQEKMADGRLLQSGKESDIFKTKRRWKNALRLTTTVLTIGRMMALRSYEIDQQVKSFVDIQNCALTDMGREKGHYIDIEKYKAKKELVINIEVQSTLRQVPETRTLLQLDQAVRELQKVEVFSQFPKEIQEKLIRKAEYLALGPRRVITRKGHKATNFYIIVSGTAMVKKVSTDPTTGEEYVKGLVFLHQGMTFGEAALITDTYRTANVLSRDRMQLLTLDAKDYVDIFVSSGPGHLISTHLPFLQSLDIMTGWPTQQLLFHSKLCSLRYFRRNFVITHDSKNSSNIYIVRTGHCKVFRFLGWPDDTDSGQNKIGCSDLEPECEESMAFNVMLKTACNHKKTRYTGDKSEHVSWKTVTSPGGKQVKFPVVGLHTINDPLISRSLRTPKYRRKFVPMKILRPEDAFGLDQLPMTKQRSNSRSVILVSLGADCIVLDKGLFCRFAVRETSEIVNLKAFHYSDDVIKNCLKDKANRDVYLERVLDAYFVKLFRQPNSDTDI